MLSNTSKYAIRAIIYLAIHAGEESKIGIKKISESLNIPSPFLGKILQSLVRRKLLSSTKGPHGGFGMGKNWAEITLYDIIVEVDGYELFDSCLLGAGLCDGHKKQGDYCSIHGNFDEARQKIIEVYKNKTILQIAEDTKKTGVDIIL